jgi:hypothetical protein
MKLFRTSIAIGSMALLGGCVVAPPGADYGYYAPAPGYYAPAPYYYAPSVRFGFGYYGGRGYGGGGYGGGGYRHWR